MHRAHRIDPALIQTHHRTARGNTRRCPSHVITAHCFGAHQRMRTAMSGASACAPSAQAINMPPAAHAKRHKNSAAKAASAACIGPLRVERPSVLAEMLAVHVVVNEGTCGKLKLPLRGYARAQPPERYTARCCSGADPLATRSRPARCRHSAATTPPPIDGFIASHRTCKTVTPTKAPPACSCASTSLADLRAPSALMRVTASTNAGMRLAAWFAAGFRAPLPPV